MKYSQDIQFISGWLRILRQLLPHAPPPVSYTHLDVYKRQGTLSAGAAVLWMLTVDCLSKDLGHGGLSCSPGPAEQIGVADPLRPDLIL